MGGSTHYGGTRLPRSHTDHLVLPPLCLTKDPGEANDFDTDVKGAIFPRRQRRRRLMHERNSLTGRYLLLDPKIFRSSGIITSWVKIVVPTP
jgi:hypothetical protein